MTNIEGKSLQKGEVNDNCISIGNFKKRNILDQNYN